jgi:radical SAM protein with 4Fe4S-binding SPASM domain
MGKVMTLNFLKMWKNVVKREINSKQVRAVNAIIFVTYRCMSRCMTCNIWQKTQDRTSEFKQMELAAPRWNQIIDRLYQAGISSVEIFGGDALLRKDVAYSMIKRCTQLGMHTFFPTNAMLLDRETVQQLVSAGLGTIYFSLDGIEELHDHIRGVHQGYTMMQEAIWNVYHARSTWGHKKPRIGIITTVSRTNVEEIANIISTLENFPLDFVELQIAGEVVQSDILSSVIENITPTPLFTSTFEKSNLLLEEQVSILTETINNLHRNKDKFKFELHLYHIEPYTAETFCQGIFPPYPCHCCTTVVTLTPSGDVVPCPNYTEFILGKVTQQEPLDSIWGNKRHRRFLKKQRAGSLPICRKCSMRHSYPGVREKLRHTFFRYFNGPFM